MGLGIAVVCSRCNLADADLLHLFWRCPRLTPCRGDLFGFFWNSACVSDTSNPESWTFRYTKWLCTQNPCPDLIRRVCIVLYYAWKVILLHWKDVTSPMTQTPWLDVNISFWGTVLSSQLNWPRSACSELRPCRPGRYWVVELDIV